MMKLWAYEGPLAGKVLIFADDAVGQKAIDDAWAMPLKGMGQLKRPLKNDHRAAVDYANSIDPTKAPPPVKKAPEVYTNREMRTDEGPTATPKDDKPAKPPAAKPGPKPGKPPPRKG